MKTCRCCGEGKDPTSFYVDPRSPDGRHPRCKACAGKAKAEWKRANPERAKAHQRTYIQRNPEAVRAAKLAYFEANKAKATAAARKW